MAADGAAEIFIYDEIGLWGVSAAACVAAVKALAAKSLTVRLNSPGGSIPDGIAIYNFLNAEAKKGTQIHVEVDGWAASIASIIMLAGQTVTISDGAFVMIHNPTMCGCGESKDFRKYADDLDKFRDTILDIYEKETGQSREDLAQWMDAETWFSAKEAVAKGFCDDVAERAQAVACAAPRNLTFKHVPQSGVRIGNINPEQENMKDIAKLLGLPEDATQEQIVAKIQQERGDSKTALAAMTTERDTLKTAADAALASAAEVVVQGAIDAKKIKAVAKEAYLKAYKANPESTKVMLDGIEPPQIASGLTPPRGGRSPLPEPKDKGGKNLAAIEEALKNCTDSRERVSLIRRLNAERRASAAGK